jgi:polyisoprenoid-binding protein YceI
VIGVVAVVLVLVVGAPYFYTRFLAGDAPDPLTLQTGGPRSAGQSASGETRVTPPATPATSSIAGDGHAGDGHAGDHQSGDAHAGGSAAPGVATTSSATASGSAGEASAIDGAWKVSEGSVVGYRVQEVLFGQSTTAVGRTSSVTGQLTIAGTQVTAGTFTVDMTTVKSDRSQRDGQFNGRIMSTSTYPTATFTLTEPIELGSVPGDRQPVDATATGNLTLRGVTRPVTLDLKAQRDGDKVEVNGSYPLTFADWQIPNPSLGPVSTEDHGILELLLVLDR